MPSQKDDLKRHISNKMIIPFFIIILVSITNCDESSDNKYINKLPDTDKKVFLDNIARRILEEVPEVKSVETSGADSGDVLEAKLKAQSDFVQKILKQEVDSLKAKRRNNATIKNNDTTVLKLDTVISPQINQSVEAAVNNTRKAEAVAASVGNKDNITTKTTHETTEHIDLTFRAHDADDDTEISTINVTPNNRKSENNEQFVPVKMKYDEEILNLEKISIKGGNRKREVMPDSLEKNHGAGLLLAKNKTRRKSDDTSNSSRTVTVNSTTTKSIKDNNNEVSKVSNTSTLEEKTTETVTEINEVVSETLTESTKKAEPVTNIPPISSKSHPRNPSNGSESSEFLGENIRVESKTEKVVETTVSNQNKTTTTESNLNITTLPNLNITNPPNLNITNIPTSEVPKYNSTSITPLTTTEATTSTTVRVENNPEKVSIITNRDESNNETSNSTTTYEAPSITETLIGLTTTTPKCDEKPCNQTKTEENHQETETTVSTIKGVETTSETNSPDAINNSTSTKAIKKIKSALRGIKNAVSKHSPKDMHYGDMQVTNAYEVSEVDPDTPAFVPQNPITERAEQVPVYIYDREHAFYNTHHRLESKPILTQSVKVSSIWETIEESLEVAPKLDSFNEMDGKRMIKVIHDLGIKRQTHPPYRVMQRLEQLPNTQEEEHPFQIHKRGLKDSLKAVRGILYTNKMFGYVPTNHERELSLNTTCIYMPHNFRQDLIKQFINYKSLLRCEDVDAKRKKNIDDHWNSAREDTRDEDHLNDEDKTYKSITDFLKRYMNRPNKSTKLDTETNIQNMSHDVYRNAITINGTTYNLYDDKSESLFRTKEGSSQESDEVKTVKNWLKTGKYKNKNKVRKDSAIIHGHKSNRLAEVLNALQKGSKWKSFEVSSEELKYLTSIDKPKSSEETSEEKKPLSAIVQEKIPQHKVKSYFNQKLKWNKKKPSNLRFDATDGNFGKLDTIEKISIITPEIDLIENIDLMLAKNIKVTRTKDEYLELHLSILKDLVKMDNTALIRFDWLGTTVDIQAALRKLLDLTEKKINHRHIHPNDMNLLKYIQELYKKAGEVLFQREEENRQNSEEASRVLNDRPSKHSRSFPKNGKTIRNPLKVLDHIWDMMSDQSAIQTDFLTKIDKKLGRVHSNLSLDEEFSIFLYTIQIRLEHFHEAIRQIASITTYNNQNWFRNIKDLFLTNAGKKEYLELLLHLFLTRFLDLIEENVMMGANEDFKQFMEEKRAEVDRTEVELVFILKILKEIKQFK